MYDITPSLNEVDVCIGVTSWFIQSLTSVEDDWIENKVNFRSSISFFNLVIFITEYLKKKKNSKRIEKQCKKQKKKKTENATRRQTC